MKSTKIATNCTAEVSVQRVGNDNILTSNIIQFKSSSSSSSSSNISRRIVGNSVGGGGLLGDGLQSLGSLLEFIQYQLLGCQVRGAQEQRSGGGWTFCHGVEFN
jgi:hypothetical protein